MMASVFSNLFGSKKGPVIHFTGHRILADPARSRFPAGREKAVGKLVDKILKREGAVAGFGGLASGADIVVAELLLRRGGELHVVLPCEDEIYLDASVREAGEAWVERYWDLLGQASNLTVLEDDGGAIDFGGASDVAMDMVMEMAQEYGLDHFQLALFDGDMTSGSEGTGADLERGRDLGWRQIEIRVNGKGKIREV